MNKFESFLAPNLGVLNIEKTREIETLNRNRKWKKLIAMQNLWIRLCSKRKKETDCNINIISWTNEFVRIQRSQYFKKKSSYEFQFFFFSEIQSMNQCKANIDANEIQIVLNLVTKETRSLFMFCVKTEKGYKFQRLCNEWQIV